MYALVVLGLAIIYLFPRITTAVPSTLISIIIVTSIALMSGLQLKTVGDMGSLPKNYRSLVFLTCLLHLRH